MAYSERKGQPENLMDEQTSQPQSSRTCLAVVLAAGEGTRMRSARPKVLHEVAGRSLLAHSLAAIAEAGINEVALVLGPGRDDVAAQAGRARPFTQTERRGTAHAVLAAREAIAQGYDDLVVAFADTPLVRPETFALLRGRLAETGAAVVVLASRRAIPRVTAACSPPARRCLRSARTAMPRRKSAP